MCVCVCVCVCVCLVGSLVGTFFLFFFCISTLFWSFSTILNFKRFSFFTHGYI